MIFDITGDLFTHGRQLKQLDFNDWIIGLLSKLPILGRLVPQIVRPIHAAQSNELGRDSDSTVKPVRVRQMRQNKTSMYKGRKVPWRPMLGYFRFGL
jgi:hypothetical protein